MMQKLGLRILFDQQVIYLANADGQWDKHTIGVSRCLKAIQSLNDGSNLYLLQYTSDGCYIDILRYDYLDKQWRQGCLFVPKGIKVEYFFIQTIVSEVEKQLERGKIKRKKLDTYLSETYKPKHSEPDVQIVDPDGMAVYYFDEQKSLSEVISGKNLFRESLTSYGTVLLIGAHTGMTADALPVISKMGPGEIFYKQERKRKARTEQDKARRNMLIAMAIVLALVVAGGIALWHYHRTSAQEEQEQALLAQRQDSIRRAQKDSATQAQRYNDSIAQAQAQEQADQIASGDLIPVPDADGSLKSIMQAFFGKWADVSCSAQGLAYANGTDSESFNFVQERGANAVELGDSTERAICELSGSRFTYKSRKSNGDGTAVIETYIYDFDPDAHMLKLRNHSSRQQGSARREPATEDNENQETENAEPVNE